MNLFGFIFYNNKLLSRIVDLVCEAVFFAAAAASVEKIKVTERGLPYILG
jgi:hypothetical protein